MKNRIIIIFVMIAAILAAVGSANGQLVQHRAAFVARDSVKAPVFRKGNDTIMDGPEVAAYVATHSGDSSFVDIHLIKRATLTAAATDSGKMARTNKVVMFVDDSLKIQTPVLAAYAFIYGLGNSMNSTNATILGSGTVDSCRHITGAANKATVITGGDGLCRIDFMGYVTAVTSSTFTLYIYKNGAEVTTATTTINFSATSSVLSLYASTRPIVIKLNKNDKIEVYSKSTSNSVQGVANGNLVIQRIDR
jgi:hypothetical protein